MPAAIVMSCLELFDYVEIVRQCAEDDLAGVTFHGQLHCNLGKHSRRHSK